MLRFMEIESWLTNVSYVDVLVVIVSTIFICRVSVALDDEGLVMGERIMNVHPSTVFGIMFVLIIMSCDKSDIWVNPKFKELV